MIKCCLLPILLNIVFSYNHRYTEWEYTRKKKIHIIQPILNLLYNFQNNSRPHDIPIWLNLKKTPDHCIVWINIVHSCSVPSNFVNYLIYILNIVIFFVTCQNILLYFYFGLIFLCFIISRINSSPSCLLLSLRTSISLCQILVTSPIKKIFFKLFSFP